jgi:quercetin dioxygenase-like cupin family protein
MLHDTIDKLQPKGWFYGPWNSSVSLPIGYANEGIREKHFHSQMYEIYLIAQGQSVAEVEGERITLKAGDVLVVEPGEVHTFVESSSNYLHFVIQTPFVQNDKTMVE